MFLFPSDEYSGHHSSGGSIVEIGEEDQDVKTTSYKMNKSQRCNIQHREYGHTIYDIQYYNNFGT